MATIAEIRQKYPQYADLSDEQLAQALHRKHYSDIPYEEFRSKVGLSSGASGSWGAGATGEWQDPKIASMSDREKFSAGGKAAFGELGLGVKQILGKATPEDVDAFRQQNASLLEDPVARSGNITGHMLTALPMMAIPGGQTVLGSGLIGGAFGAAHPVGTGESRIANTVTGAGISGGITAGLKTLGRIIRPIRNVNTPVEQDAVNTLRNEGVRLSVGQQTGSKATQAAERMLRDNPYTGPAMSQEAQRQAESFTRAALKTIGEDAKGATPEVLGRAKTRIGNVMDEIYSRYAIQPSTKAMVKMTELEKASARRLGSGNGMHGGGNPIQNVANDIREHLKQNGGKIDGKFYQKIRRDLQALESKPDTAELARDFREGLDDAFHSVASPADRAALTEARGQYRNLLAIADAADTTNRGFVSPATLAQRLKAGKYTKGEFRFRGEEELAKLARSASTVVDRFPNSGTAARAGAQLIAPSVVGGASYLNDGDATKAAQLAAMTYGLPKAAAFALNNPSTANYLARGIPMPPVANQLAQYALRIAPPVATSLVVSK